MITGSFFTWDKKGLDTSHFNISALMKYVTTRGVSPEKLQKAAGSVSKAG